MPLHFGPSAARLSSDVEESSTLSFLRPFRDFWNFLLLSVSACFCWTTFTVDLGTSQQEAYLLPSTCSKPGISDTGSKSLPWDL